MTNDNDKSCLSGTCSIFQVQGFWDDELLCVECCVICIVVMFLTRQGHGADGMSYQSRYMSHMIYTNRTCIPEKWGRLESSTFILLLWWLNCALKYLMMHNKKEPKINFTRCKPQYCIDVTFAEFCSVSVRQSVCKILAFQHFLQN